MHIVNRKYTLGLLSGVIFAVFIGLSALSRIRLEGGPYFEKLFLIGYGGVPLPLEIEPYLKLMLSLLVPQIVLVFILADYMLKDLTICSVYVFTRTNKRKQWFFRKAFELFLFAFLFYLFQFMTLFSIGQVAKLAVFDIFGLINLMANELILLVLISFIYIFTVNILSLKIGIKYSFLTIILIIALSPLLAFANTNMLKYIPISNFMLIWHDSENLLPYRDLIGDYIPNFTITFSISYALILILLLIIIGIKMIESLEIMGFENHWI